jgi:hypothetical protein
LRTAVEYFDVDSRTRRERDFGTGDDFTTGNAEPKEIVAEGLKDAGLHDLANGK